MISLGQINSIVSCPGLTTHSELNAEQQAEAQTFPTTIRFAMGIENPMDLIEHIIAASKLSIDQAIPDFFAKFMPLADARKMAKDNYIDMQQYYADAIL